MKHSIKRTIEAALENSRGDDLERAETAFRWLSIEEMGKEYGESGQTRQEILDEYRARVLAVKKAQTWVQQQEED